MHAADDTLFECFAGPRAARLCVRAGIHAPLWYAILLGPAWFFWRRMFLVGSLMPILPLLTGLLRVDSARLPFLVDLAMPVMLMVPSFLARHLYAAAFELRCRRARALHLDAEQTRHFLSAAGGVSPLGGVLGLIFWLPILFAVLRGLFAPLIRHLLP